MKILLCVEFYYPSIGGAQEVVRQIAERLYARGHDISVATTHLNDRYFSSKDGVQINSFRVSGNLVRGIHGEVDSYRKYLKECKADLILFYAAQQWTFDAAISILDEISAKKILVPCGYSGLHLKEYNDYFIALPEALRKLDATVYHSKSYRDIRFARDNNLSNIIFIPNGADESEFNAIPDPDFLKELGAEQAIVLLTVGSFNGMKGHHEVAKAFSMANFGLRKAILILNGNPPPRGDLSCKNKGAPRIKRLITITRIKRLITIIRNQGLFFALNKILILVFKLNYIDHLITQLNKGRFGNKKAIITDFSRSQLIQAYIQSDIFVFASNVEYSPLVLFEASAAGLPFLSVPVGNSIEIAEWTQAGKICAASIDKEGYTRVDPKELANNIESLISNNELMKALSINGRKAHLERFNWDMLSKEYERLFFDVINR